MRRRSLLRSEHRARPCPEASAASSRCLAPSDVLLEVPEHLLVVLDGALLGRLGESERRLAAGVPDRAVCGEPLLELPQQHRDLAIDIVVDSDLRLRRVTSME